MQALILAAGRGRRLGQRSCGLPKCLLEVGRRPLIEHQIEMLATAGVGPVGMVLGYCADEIQEIVGIRAEYILNPRWRVTNSLYSFWLAREWVVGSVTIVNCDVLFHPEILDRLLAAKKDVIAYDSSSGNGREHMKVKVVNDRLASMSKDLPQSDVSGENVGMLCLTADTSRALFRRAQEIIDGGGEKDWLGSAVCQISNEREIHAIDVAGLPWGEIDFPYDLQRVRKKVWPAINKDARKRKICWRRMRWIAAVLVISVLVHLAFRVWFSPIVLAWETLEVKGEKTRIFSEGQEQLWPLLKRDQPAYVQLNGPASVRIESRLLLSSDVSPQVPYVLEVSLDGQQLDWFKRVGVPSASWKHQECKVAKIERIHFDVPCNLHTVSIRLIASDSDGCLLRLLQKNREEGDE